MIRYTPLALGSARDTTPACSTTYHALPEGAGISATGFSKRSSPTAGSSAKESARARFIEAARYAASSAAGSRLAASSALAVPAVAVAVAKIAIAASNL